MKTCRTWQEHNPDSTLADLLAWLHGVKDNCTEDGVIDPTDIDYLADWLPTTPDIATIGDDIAIIEQQILLHGPDTLVSSLGDT